MSAEKEFDISWFIIILFVFPICFVIFFAFGFYEGMYYNTKEVDQEHIAICMKYGGSKYSCNDEIY